MRSFLFDLVERKKRDEEELNLTAKKDVLPFLEWCQWVSPQYDFSYKWLRYVNEQMEKSNIALFSVPPQHGKSTTFTVHKAAYLLANFPKTRIIIISYNIEVTKRFHREILVILDKVGINLHSRSQTEIVHANKVGSISFCGFNGGITSKPAEVIIVDDPIRSAADACSARLQELLESGLGTSIFPRLQKDFKLWITQTRWHDRDLIGQALATFQSAGFTLPYVHINLPAICNSTDDPLGREIGEVLCPERFSKELILQKMLVAKGDAEALYQGSPSPPDGAIFKVATIEYFSDLSIIPKNTINFLSIDARFIDDKHSGDFVSVLSCAYDIQTKLLFVTQIFNERIGFTETVEQIESLLPYNQFAIIEKKANGDAIISTLKKKYFGQLIPIEPEGGKIARAHAVQPFIRTRRLRVFEHAANLAEFKNQTRSFPRSAHDDIVDSLTQAINYVINTLDPIDYSNLDTQGLDTFARLFA